MSSVPPQSKRVFKGKIFEIYQWKQKLFNGQTAIFEKAKRPDKISVITQTKNDKIVIIRQQQPGSKKVFCLPGGQLNKKETPKDFAKRELKEETGYTAKKIKLAYSFQPIYKIDWNCYYFIAENAELSSNQDLDAGGEKITVELVKFKTFIKMILDEKLFIEDRIRFLVNKKILNKEKITLDSFLSL